MCGRVTLAQNKFYHAHEHAEHHVESHSGKPKRSWFKFWTRSRYGVPVSSHHEDRAQRPVTGNVASLDRVSRPTTLRYSDVPLLNLTGIQLYTYVLLCVAVILVLFPVHWN